MAEAKELALALAKALDDKRGKDIKVLETGKLTTLADYFVLCTGTSSTQVRALADLCEETAEKLGEPLHHREGHGDNNWILLDFSAVVVHVFDNEGRSFYDLERLWNDAAELDLTGILTKEEKI